MTPLLVARLSLRLSALCTMIYELIQSSYFDAYLWTWPWPRSTWEFICSVTGHVLAAFSVFGLTDRFIAAFVGKPRAGLENLSWVEAGAAILRGGAFWVAVAGFGYALRLPHLMIRYREGLVDYVYYAILCRPLVLFGAAALLFAKTGRVMWVLAPPPGERRFPVQSIASD